MRYYIDYDDCLCETARALYEKEFSMAHLKKKLLGVMNHVVCDPDQIGK